MFESSIAGFIRTGAQWLVNPSAHGFAEGDEHPRIYYSNHASHLDFVLLWSALPAHLRSRTRPVAACDYWDRVPVRRYMIHSVLHGVLVQRSESEHHRSISAMLQALDQQQSLILFPEGTRGTADGLGLFKSGIYHLAQARPWIELVPVWISNTAAVLPKGSWLPVPLLCSVTFGPAVRIQHQEDKAAFLQRLRRRLVDLETQ